MHLVPIDDLIGKGSIVLNTKTGLRCLILLAFKLISETGQSAQLQYIEAGQGKGVIISLEGEDAFFYLQDLSVTNPNFSSLATRLDIESSHFYNLVLANEPLSIKKPV